MIVDFQQHYTPPELLKGNRDAVSVQLDEHGNPNYLLNPLLSDLNAANIRFKDLQTEQSSLEDIFVRLVERK